jgi:hypothetical protein
MLGVCLVVLGIFLGTGFNTSDNDLAILVVPLILAVTAATMTATGTAPSKLIGRVAVGLLLAFAIVSILSVGPLILPGALILVIAASMRRPAQLPTQ